MGETFIHDAAPQPLPSLPGAGVGSWHLGSSSEHVPTPQALDPQLSFARQELPTVLGLGCGPVPPSASSVALEYIFLRLLLLKRGPIAPRKVHPGDLR